MGSEETFVDRFVCSELCLQWVLDLCFKDTVRGESTLRVEVCLLEAGAEVLREEGCREGCLGFSWLPNIHISCVKELT